MATRGLFIAGTNTEVGKTHIAAMIAERLGCQRPARRRLQTHGERLP